LTSNDIKKVPLVLDVHGYGVCPLFQAAFTGWKEKAEEECFVVVWPSGNNDEQFGAPCFNLEGFLRSEDYGTATGNNMTTCPCCCYKDKGAPTKEPNDPLFLKLAIESVVESFEAKTKPAPTMTDHTSTRLAIDPTRVYMAGHSNGCIASLAMAALYSDTIAAVCCHAGAVVTPFSDQDYRPVPIWLAHGKKDKVVPYEGATLFDGPPVGAIGFWSTDQTMDYLAKQNDCEEETITTLETNQTGIVGTVFRQTRCHQNANIEVVALFESGHFPYELPESFFIGLGLEETPTKIDTTSLAWDFCSKHVNPNAATPDHEPIPQWISTLNSGSIHQSIRNRA
jgi:poly(3-hydroxybutyrate) depolymerase